MGHLVQDVTYRARRNGRQNRFGWLVFISAVNLALWSVVIALIARAT